YDVGCYAISAALWAFGRPPHDVTARHEVGTSGVDVMTEAVLSFDGGDAEIRAGINEPPAQWLVVRGETGEMDLPGAAFTSWTQARDEPLTKGRQLVREGKLVVVSRGRRPVQTVPSDLGRGGRLVKGLGGALTVLRDAGYSNDEALRWLLTDDDSLSGRPIDAM